MKTPVRCASLCLALALLGGCQTTNQPPVLMSQKPATEIRAMESRQYETGDLQKVFRAIIATYQDLGYTIVKVEPAAATVSAEKKGLLRMTSSAFKRGNDRVIVRSNAVISLSYQFPQGHQVDAPEFYQQRFFEPLSKALFLTALQVEGPPDETEKQAVKNIQEQQKAVADEAKADAEKRKENIAREEAEKAAKEKEKEKAQENDSGP